MGGEWFLQFPTREPVAKSLSMQANSSLLSRHSYPFHIAVGHSSDYMTTTALCNTISQRMGTLLIIKIKIVIANTYTTSPYGFVTRLHPQQVVS